MTIEITPFDTFFFKDGKPFSMGDDVWASGIFPPPPSVFYGMLRTAYAAQKNIPLENIVEETKALRINSILMKQGQDYLFPYPADLISTNNKESRLLSVEKNNLMSSIGNKYEYILKANTNKKIKEKFGKAYIDDNAFEEYLSGSDNIFWILEMDDVLTKEPKVGIGKELETSQTSEGKLYRVGMIRPENQKGDKLMFIIDFEGLELRDEGLLRIGAEAKAGYYHSTQNLEIINAKSFDKYLKIYIATPAIFKNGNLPEFLINEEYNGLKINLLTYSIGKPLFIGGFDMKERKPKPMQKAVPAGSVYYCESENAQAIAELLHGSCISEKNAGEGFGLCYCGTFSVDK